MALKKPLVITAGQIQQLQAADVIDPASVPSVQTLTNNSGGTLVKLRAVYSTGSGTFAGAIASGVSTAKVVGLVYDTSILNAAAGLIQTDGVVEGTTGQWDVVTGGAGGLTAGSEYFLSPSTAGAITTTAPTSDGQVVAPVGVALSTTKLRLGVKTTILL